MADSLFDSRYRYDYIYPRGRSGETLRATDTADNDRPVVIKRPAPNDAPPIRAGQEVSILNERKALMRLAGQPTLTALLGGGQFFVGGIPHQYIVMERAEGTVIADQVIDLASRGERLPELEMLVIVDKLLEVLSAAHQHDIVYNDVDAKHLFWNRDEYRLKIIDWGNAVFLEGDEITPQGISRQSDVFQVGELLYFMVTGGGRADLPRDAGDDFRADFGYDAEKAHPRLQAIISKALHPNPRLRYRAVDDLRKDLTAYRDPLDRERNGILGRVIERLKRERSKNELHSLMAALEPAQAMDPGFPPVNEARREILDRLSDIEISADLDAARIYMESGSWQRALALLDDLRSRARGESADLVALLIDWAALLLEAEARPAPPAVIESIGLLFERQPARAANLLLSQIDSEKSRDLQLLLAERISAHVHDILLLRPNLHRLDVAMQRLAEERVPLGEPRAVLNEILAELDDMPATSGANLIVLRDRFRTIVDSLTALGTLLEAVNASYHLPNTRLPMSSLDRALNATMALADNMHVIGKQATTSPRDAMAALDSSRVIDPSTPLWDAISRLLDGLYELLGAYQIYVPGADGSDLEAWLQSTQRDLQPFTERLFDEMLVGIVRGLQTAQKNWQSYAAAAIQGNRIGAVTALAQATEAVGTVSPTLAGWLNQLRTVIQNAAYVERHSLYGGLGRALADGWEAYDRGRLADAERLGAQAFEVARNESEKFAARRLRELTETTRSWVERNGISDRKRTEAALTTTELLYTVDENNTRNGFSAQMPTKETYLRAMGKGLVDLFSRNSTAAVRILFFNYILLGTLDAYENEMDDAAFWREAAGRTLGENAARHPAARALDDLIEKRRDFKKAEDLMARVNGPHAFATLEVTRKALEDNPQSRSLDAAIFSLRELEAAARDWSDGEYRAAGNKLENAVKALDQVEAQAAVTLTGYRAWLMDLIAAAADLHTASRNVMQIVEAKPDEPKDAVRAALHRQVEVTTRMLGQAYAAQLRTWRDTYDAFLTVYADRGLRRSAKLTRFNELFRAMFIDRHPAYPLYRHWYEVTESAPEFPAPPTDEPTPRPVESEPPLNLDLAPPRPGESTPHDGIDAEFPLGDDFLETPDVTDRLERRRKRSRVPLMLVGMLLAMLAVGAIFLLSGQPINGGPVETPQTTGEATVNDTGGGTETGAMLPGTTDDPAAVSPTDDAVNDAANDGINEETPASENNGGFTIFTQPPRETAPFTTPSLVPTGESTPNPLLPGLPATPVTVAENPTATLIPPTAVPASPTPTDEPTVSPTATPLPTSTVPPEGLRGEQDLLALARTANNAASGVPWTTDRFSATGEDNVWRLGLGSGDTSDDLIAVRIPAAMLDTLYGNNASTRVQSVTATLALTTYLPELVEQNQVYFGALLGSSADSSQTIGLQVVLNQPGTINVGQRQGDDVQISRLVSVNAVVVRVRLTRDPVTGVVTVYYNNDQIGQPVLFVGPNDPVEPILFVRGGGVIVSVTEWSVTLR